MHIKFSKKFCILIAITLVLFILIGTSIYCYFSLQRFSRNSKAVINTQPVSDSGIVNILVTGTDLSKSRTDSIMLVSYNSKKGTLKIVSVPRDTLIRIKGKRAKINAANVYGGENLLISSIEELLGIGIHYYTTIDYTGFDKVVDAIGGVDMTIPNTMNYDDPVQNLHIHFTKGTTVHLDGKKAEEFFRWRKNNDGTGLPNGDIGRIKDEHLLVEKILEKVKSPFNLFKMPSLLNTASQYIETNMKPSEIIKYGLAFVSVDKSKIESSTLKGSTPYISGVSYFVYNSGKNTELIAALKDGTENVRSDKNTLKIEVLNCSRKTGLAAKYASHLKQKGYVNIVTGNGSPAANSKVIINGLDSSVNSTIQNDFDINNVVINQSKNREFDIVVMLGKSFKSENE